MLTKMCALKLETNCQNKMCFMKTKGCVVIM